MFDIKYNVDLSSYTTFGIKSTAAVFAEYDTPEDLPVLLDSECLRDRTLFNLGSGSNVMFSGHFEGGVLHSLVSGIEVIDKNDTSVLVRVGSGVEWDSFVEWAVGQSYYGVENLSAIPGTAGASAVQNIGAYGAEAKDVIERVEVFDMHSRRQVELSERECCFGYRDSVFKHTGERYIVTHVVYRLGLKPYFNLAYGALSKLRNRSDLTLQDVRDYIVNVRNEKLPAPADVGSAGSFFKNPIVSVDQYEAICREYADVPHYATGCAELVKLPAGWLIEHAGLKGTRCGGAEVWPKQCLVIANTGGATADDVLELKTLIQKRVSEVFNVLLEPEVLLVGSDGSLLK